MSAYKFMRKTSILSIITLLSVLFLREYKILLIIILILVSFLSLYKKEKEYFYIYMFGFIAGPISESLCILTDAWTYNNEDLIYFNFAYYLPFAWGMASLAFLNLYKRLKK